jgi:DNA-binding NarL/FixJ family response regulator
MNDKLTLVVADDHPLYREGVVRTLTEQPDFDVVGEGASADEAVSMVAAQMPDLVLLDISMAGGGLSAARRIAEAFPAVKIVMLTVSEQDDDVHEALKAGVLGYVLKGVGGAELVRVVRDVATGSSYVSPSLAARLLKEGGEPGGRGTHPSGRLATLTDREREILEHVANGMSNKEVARSLDLQEKTVKHYMTNILKKLQVRNRVEAAILAREAGRR